MTSTEIIQTEYDNFLRENAKFNSGNSAAGTRARKALGEMAKAIKIRRTEITEAKNAKKSSKV
jgi:hypothetical protein